MDIFQMRKSLVVLAVLSVFTVTASAQDSVTVYGLLDVAIARLSGGNGDRTLMSAGNNSTSRLGFRGFEDLGGGLRAKFVLEAPLKNDDPGSSFIEFTRYSYVGLAGNFGEVTAGRHLTPLLFAIIAVDPFIETFAGSSLNLGIQPLSNIRNSNSVLYTSPNMSGFKVRALYTFGEQPDSSSANSQTGLSVEYANGPLWVGLATHDAEDLAGTDTQTDSFLGASYALPNKIKLGLGYATHDGFGTIDADNILAAVTVPFGAHTLMITYLTFDDNTVANQEAQQAALAYTYTLSKRTNFYASWADINNENGAAFRTWGAFLAGPTVTATTEFNFGLRHRF